jgi:hypothetical protein
MTSRPNVFFRQSCRFVGFNNVFDVGTAIPYSRYEFIFVKIVSAESEGNETSSVVIFFNRTDRVDSIACPWASKGAVVREHECHNVMNRGIKASKEAPDTLNVV